MRRFTTKIKLVDGSLYSLRNVPKPTLETDLPPLLHPPKENERIYLSPEEIQQLRTLRDTDPDKWTIKALSKHFQCTTETVEAYAHTPQKVRLAQREAFNRHFDNADWVQKVRIINRMRRKALW